MAITSTVIGNLGAGKVTESTFTFETDYRRASEINNDWTVPLGNYLFVWTGETSTTGTYGTITINGIESVSIGTSNSKLGNYHILNNISQIQARGTGSKGFKEGTVSVAYVRVA